jgi:membrane-associated phospholipid phosphatase
VSPITERRVAFDDLPAVLVAGQLAGVIVCVIAYRLVGLHLGWTGVPIALPFIAAALVAWIATRHTTVTDAALAVALLFSCSLLVLLLQYPAIAWGRPMIDGALLRADALLGVSVPALASWTATHHSLVGVLRGTYDGFFFELAIVVAILAARHDRAALWEFVTEFHVCLAIAVAACALWPATEPWTRQHLADLADQSRAVAQIAGFHDWTLRFVDINQPAGLVAMPSFHVAAAWTAVWAVRRSRPAIGVLSVLNVGLTLATILLGVHYAVDVLAGFALAAACVALYHAPAAIEARLGARVALRLRTPHESSAPFA